jgi:hypothetical protein
MRGDCLFAPLDRAGSFKITAAKRISALVKVTSPGSAEASWSGPAGSDPAAASLGSASYNGSGCWVVDGTYAEQTAVCAWDKDRKLFLGPTPFEPPSPGLAWGERAGMSARIVSSASLGTESATVTAVKDKDGAINQCRESFDYSIKCIDDTLKDSSLAPEKTTLHANCKTKRFTDFWGRNLEVSGDDILDLDTNEKLGASTATGSTVAWTAFETLFPKEPK